MNTNTMSAGDGYRLLADDETIQLGDEFYFGSIGEWRQVKSSVGSTPLANNRWRRSRHYGLPTRVFRRKADVATPEECATYTRLAATHSPGAGYRILAANEILVATDECQPHRMNGQGKWFSTLQAGLPVAFKSGAYCVMIYRRRIETPAAPKSIEPGEGYRLLTTDELLESGDEFYCGDWFPTLLGAASKQPNGLSYRRKVVVVPQASATKTIEPGNGYRLVTEGEKFLKGDEFFEGHEWCPTGCIGSTCRKPLHLPHRRRCDPDKLVEFSWPAPPQEDARHAFNEGYKQRKMEERADGDLRAEKYERHVAFWKRMTMKAMETKRELRVERDTLRAELDTLKALVNCHGLETALCEIANLSPLDRALKSSDIATEALKAHSTR